MSNDLSEIIAAHEATNAKLLLRVDELEAQLLEEGVKYRAEQAACRRVAQVRDEYHREAESLRDQVATLTKDVEDAKEENSSHAVNRRAEREMFGRQLDATKADAARLRELIQRVDDASAIRCQCKSYGCGCDVSILGSAVNDAAYSDSDSAEWIEAKIAERTALHVEREKSLEQQLVAALNGAARAELRARDLHEQLRHMTGLFAGLHEHADKWGDYQRAKEALAASPDSDGRLREVMLKEVTAKTDPLLQQLESCRETQRQAHEALLMESVTHRAANGENEYSERVMSALAALDESTDAIDEVLGVKS